MSAARPDVGWPWPIPGYNSSGWISEPYGPRAISTADGVLRVRGNSRIFLVQDYTAVSSWDDIEYVRFDMLGKTLRYTVDVSRVQCLCDAALMFSYMVGCWFMPLPHSSPTLWS